MARTEATNRKEIVNYAYSVAFNDGQNQHISSPYHASYTQDIVNAFTILVYGKLFTRTFTTNDFWALVSNGTSTNNNNYYLLGNSDSRTVTGYIANGATNDNITSDVTLDSDWNWMGMSYQQGSSLSVIVNKTIKSKVPAITATMSAQTLRIGTLANANLRINGYLARVWIFGGVITQADLNKVVDFGEKPTALTQALIWDMNEGSGTSVDDSSPNSNIGTLNGGILWDSTVLPSVARSKASGRSFADARTTV